MKFNIWYQAKVLRWNHGTQLKITWCFLNYHYYMILIQVLKL
jgi:hypothetical protein